MKMVFCPHCGLLLPPGPAVCPRCGTAVPAASSAAAPAQTPAPRYTLRPAQGGLSTGGYFVALCLFAIPLVGLLVILVWSCGGTRNPARRRLARAYLLRQVILSVLLLLLALGLTVLPFWQLTGVLPATRMLWGGIL